MEALRALSLTRSQEHLKEVSPTTSTSSVSSMDGAEGRGAAATGSAPRVGAGTGTTGNAAALISVRESLRGRSFLITGATGFLGGTVLEQLLRVAGDIIGNVYVLVRGRAGRSARERLGRVMGSGLFHMVRTQHAAALKKVVVLDGDLNYPGLGVSEAALTELQAEPSVLVIHSAARIALDDPVQDALRNNYVGTKALLQLVESRLPRCAGFVYVSTAFVGIHMPHGSCVQERLLPLMFGDQRVDHDMLATELLNTDKYYADMRANLLCQNWGLPNTYLVSKHLSEMLVEQYHKEGRIPGGAAIVRPSFVSAIAGDPYPGYVGNLAGPSGYMTAFALGFFNNNVAAWSPHNLFDGVPADVAAALILAAAGCLASGIRSREDLLALAETAPPPPGGSAPRYTGRETPELAAAAAAEAAKAVVSGQDWREAAAAEAPSRSEWRCYSFSPRDDLHVHPYGERDTPQTTRGVAAAAAADVRAAAAVAAAVEPPRRRKKHGEMLIFHAATSTMNPVLHFEAYELAYRFFSVHTPKWRLGGYVPTRLPYTPVPWKVNFKKKITGAKVAMAASMLSCFGHARAARKLRTGFAAWDYATDIKHDKTVFFSIRNGLALERCMARQELVKLPVVWREDYVQYDTDIGMRTRSRNWVEYGNTYMAGVMALFMGLPVPPSTPELPHRFQYIHYVLLNESDLPPLAGTRGVPLPAPAAAAAAAAARVGRNGAKLPAAAAPTAPPLVESSEGEPAPAPAALVKGLDEVEAEEEQRDGKKGAAVKVPGGLHEPVKAPMEGKVAPAPAGVVEMARA